MFESPEQERELRANLDRHLVLLGPEHSARVLEWRNRADVRENMYTTHVISPEEHARWLSRLEGDPTRRYFVFHVDEEPVGVVGFTEIARDRGTASWAFYSGNPQVKGLGSLMERCALLYAFERLELRRLSCEVLSHNLRVVEMHRRFGFLLEGIRRAQYVREGIELDIYQLALSRTDWDTARMLPFPGALYRRMWTDEIDASSPSCSGTISPALVARGLSPGARHLASRDRVIDDVPVGTRLVAESRVLTRVGRFHVVESTVKRSSQIVAILERDFDVADGA